MVSKENDTMSEISFQTDNGMDDSGYCCSPVSLAPSEYNFDHEEIEEITTSGGLPVDSIDISKHIDQAAVHRDGLCSPLPLQEDQTSTVKQSCDSNPIDSSGMNTKTVSNIEIRTPKTIKKHGKYCRFKSRLRRKIQKCKNVINTVLSLEY